MDTLHLVQRVVQESSTVVDAHARYLSIYRDFFQAMREFEAILILSGKKKTLAYLITLREEHERLSVTLSGIINGVEVKMGNLLRELALHLLPVYTPTPLLLEWENAARIALFALTTECTLLERLMTALRKTGSLDSN